MDKLQEVYSTAILCVCAEADRLRNRVHEDPDLEKERRERIEYLEYVSDELSKIRKALVV